MIEIILEPGVFNKSELERNNVDEITNPSCVTFTLTLFCEDVVSNTSPLATGSATPSPNDKIAPFVYDEFLSRSNVNTLVSDVSVPEALHVPVTERIGKLVAENTLPTTRPVADP